MHQQTQVAPRPAVSIATLRRRLSSMLYESLLLLGVIAIGFIAPLVAIGVLLQIQIPGALEWLHLFLLLGIYFIWLWRRNGQTLAMQTWQLQLVDIRTGKTPSLARCLLRYVLAWPSMLFILSGFGLLWAAFVDRERQFPHDRLAGTCVVFNPNQAQETGR
ncbi:RDD family protein [Uliginosibacterium sp. 31-16]|uniref:RDD family protein n=1 Tax=Uliginosibacterium sp. 31-16 TaxID=3068315 RepID=UPI00273F6528|nr:RDD family protein [Uliginosibacterium sp. 31-16]MDP5241201.1 RDD family protein [Uliginosibacterium sp. 31-16]